MQSRSAPSSAPTPYPAYSHGPPNYFSECMTPDSKHVWQDKLLQQSVYTDLDSSVLAQDICDPSSQVHKPLQCLTPAGLKYPQLSTI